MIDGYHLTSGPLAELHAAGPHPDLGPGLALFGHFIGTWDMRVRFIDQDGTVSFDGPGVWSFGWVLDGRAIQDVLTYPVGGDFHAGVRGIGTSLRRYDPPTGTWSVVWLGANTGNLITLTARPDGEGILLEGFDVNGAPLRWSFTDVTPDSFRWCGHVQGDSGEWRLEQEMLARRRPELP